MLLERGRAIWQPTSTASGAAAFTARRAAWTIARTAAGSSRSCAGSECSSWSRAVIAPEDTVESPGDTARPFRYRSGVRPPRICCLDLDTFFVSVERLLDPSLE